VLVCKMRVSLSLAQPWEIICLPACLPGCLSVCLLVRLCSNVGLYLRVPLAAARSAREGE
jgi:hypothetical protein